MFYFAENQSSKPLRIAIVVTSLLVVIGLGFCLYQISSDISSFISSSSKGEYSVISSNQSPNGQYTATVYSGWGGGAAGWTFIRVALNPSNEPFDIEFDKKGEGEKNGKSMVFSTGGASNIKTKWIDTKTLLITYKVPTRSAGFSVYKALTNKDAQVKIKFVEEIETE